MPMQRSFCWYASRFSSVWLSCLAGTRQSPIRIKASGDPAIQSRAPGAFRAPENRRCPVVSNSLAAQAAYRILACGRADRANPFVAHDRGVPV